MNVFELFAKLNLDSSGYESGLKGARSLAGTMGRGISAALGVGTAAVTAATGATAAFAKSAVATGQSFDAAMSGVAATLGYSAEQLKNDSSEEAKNFQKLREFALKMGESTVFSATQAADALKYMALAGYDTEKSMRMLPAVLNMAAAGGMDLARASDMVTDASSALGLTEKRTSQMVNEFAKAASSGNTSVGQLGEAFLTVGGLARELNGGMITLSDGTKKSVDSVQELEIAFTAMANAGIKGSEAGTHMRNMISKLTSPSKEGTEQLEKLGVAVFDDAGNMRSLADIMGDLSGALGNVTQEEKLKAITDLFNARDIASAEALLNAVNQDWNVLGEKISAAGDAANDMAGAQTENLSGDIKKFNSALEIAKITISDKLTPALREFVQFGTNNLSKIVAAFKKDGLTGAMGTFGEVLSEGLKKITSEAPEMVKAGLELLKALGKGLIDNLPVLLDSMLEVGEMLFTELVSLLGKVSDFISTSDFGVFATKLINFLINAITNQGAELLSLGITIVLGLLDGLFDALPAVITGVIELMDRISAGIAENLPDLIESIVEKMPVIFGMVLTLLMKLSESLRENAGIIVEAGLDLIVALVSGILDSLPILLQTLPTIVTNIAGIINDNAPKLLFTGVELIVKIIAGIVEAIPTLIAEFPKIIKAIFSVIMAINWINLGSTIITGIKNGITTMATKIPDALRSIGSQAKDWFRAINWHTLGADIIDLIKIGISSMRHIIPNLLKGIGRTAIDIFKAIDWKSLGKFMLEGLWAGMKGTTAWLKEKISEWCNGVWDSITSFFSIGSPSKLFAWAGENMALGLGMGFSDEMQRDVASEITDAVPTTFDVNAETKAAGTGGFVMPINIENFYNNTKDDIEALTNQIYYSLYDKILREKVVTI